MLVVFLQTTLFVDHFSECEITFEGMKTISSFLSQDGIVLEELDLRSMFKSVFFEMVKLFHATFIELPRIELKPIEEAIADGILTHINILVDSSFEIDFQTWRTELVPLFISKCELLCFTQDINSEESLLHYLGVNF